MEGEMKESIVIAILAILSTVSVASAGNGDAVNITPYAGGPVFEVSEGDFVYIRAGWATCTYGLTRAFTKQANLVLETPGNSLVSTRKEAKGYWAEPFSYTSPNISYCFPNTDYLYRSWWDYPLGYLEAGESDFHFMYWMDHTIPDGTDWDGDGKLDHWQLDIDVWFTVIVE
jgi:hypothetical protein